VNLKPTMLITGASSGIGAAALRLFASQGYRVLGTCRNPESTLAKWKSENYFDGIPLPTLLEADLAIPGEVEVLHRRAKAALDGIDILLNNAGMGELGAVEETSPDFARQIFEVNFFAAARLTQLVLPAMRAKQSGILLNMGSIVHSLQFPFKALYCASKSALSSYTLSLRHEVSPYGIRVHLFEPGWVQSQFHERLQPVLKPGSVYAPRLKPFLDFSRDRNPKTTKSEAVAHILLKTVQNPNAPVRIPVGSDAKTFFLASRFLSHAMQDRILQWKLVRKNVALGHTNFGSDSNLTAQS
jgi:short-subunit dehydrogenase